MPNLKLPRRPTPQQSALQFRASLNPLPNKKLLTSASDRTAPPTLVNKTYTNPIPSSVRAVPEYDDMGGVVIAYPGTVPYSKNQVQLPPGGPRAFGIPNELIVRMQQNDSKEPVHIFVMCADFSERNNIISDLLQTAAEINVVFNPNNLHLIPWDTDTYWTRDYAPWWIYNKKTENYGIVKHGYTTLGGGSVGLVEGAEDVDPRVGQGIFRPNDDFGAVKLSDYLYGPIRKWNKASWPNHDTADTMKLQPIKEHEWYYLGLLDVGGNYMVTGNGTIASSYLVAKQNELPLGSVPIGPVLKGTDPTQQIVDARMEYILSQFNRFMGLHNYHALSDPTGTYIGHIDCWGKFLADDKVLIAQSEDPKINLELDKISSYFEHKGFKVFRVLCQNIYVPDTDDEPATTAAYTNSLILNKHVYVPLAGPKNDPLFNKFNDDALLAYRAALKDDQGHDVYTVVGIYGKPDFPWLGTDAMHCRTNAIPRQVVNRWLRSQKNSRPVE
jgi:agmatine deiminase